MVRFSRTCCICARSRSTSGRSSGISTRTCTQFVLSAYDCSSSTLRTSVAMFVCRRSGGRWRAKSSRFWTMRLVRSASWTSRPASCFMSSGSRSSPRISWLNAMIAASGLLSSWATPDTSWPIASIFWACSSSLVRRSWSDRSRTSERKRRWSPSSTTRTSTSTGNSEPSGRCPRSLNVPLPWAQTIWRRRAISRSSADMS